MNIAISVGLITAGSTLAGGIIASVTALRVQSKQLMQRYKLAEADRIDKYLSQHRMIRRETYINLLNKCDEMDRLILECWKTRPNPDHDMSVQSPWLELDDGLRDLEGAVNTVRLEGPQEVIDAAAAVYKTCKDEEMHAHGLSVKHIGAATILHQVKGNKYAHYYGERLTLKKDLVKAAAKALAEGVTPTDRADPIS